MTDRQKNRCVARIPGIAALLLTAVVSGCWGASRVDREPDADLLGSTCVAGEEAWLRLVAPDDGTRHVGPAGLIEVRGRAGAGAPVLLDIVVLVDRSVSTFALAGVDVDRDGILGRAAPRKRADGSTDPAVVGRYLEDGGGLLVNATDEDDTIIRAEFAATQGLLERVDPAATRLGLIVFAGSAKVKAELTAPSDLFQESLRGIRVLPQSGGTNFQAGILRGLQMLLETSADREQIRHCVMLLLSDGVPTQPEPTLKAEAKAIAAAKLAAKANVRIYSIALGPETRVDLEVFEHLAALTDGQVMYFDTPGDVMTYLPHINLTRLEDVAIWNATTGKAVRAMRLFPDGSFDGYVPLVPGENLIRVRARARGGSVYVAERKVHFEKRLPATPQEVRLLEEFQEKLRVRTIETELARKAREKRLLPRDLRIKVEP